MLNKITKFKRKQEKAAAAQQKRQNCLLTIVGKLETPEKITAFLDTLNKIAELCPRQFEIKKKLYKPTDWDIEVAGVLTRSPGKHPLVAEWSSHKNRAC